MSVEEKHIAIINGIYPPDGGASGRVANDLVTSLTESGLKVSVVTSRKKYKEAIESADQKGIVYKVQTFNSTTYKLVRLIGALINSHRLLKKAKELKPSTYIICTDPSFLQFFATFMLRKEKWVLWAMDLYPEAFVANGLIGGQNWVVSYYKTLLSKSPPHGIISLGVKQNEYLKSTYNYDSAWSAILPCGVKTANDPTQKQPKWKNDQHKIYFAYTGNLGEAHSADFLIRIIRLSDPVKHQFLLSLFGSKAKRVKKTLARAANVNFLDWIPEEELGHLDIQMVTLDGKWTNVCVPSKAVSAICDGAPLIYHGNKEGDIYHEYGKAAWHVENTDDSIHSFYLNLNQSDILKKKKNAQVLKEYILQKQKEAYAQITNHLNNE